MSSLPERWLPWLRFAVAPTSVGVATLLQASATTPLILERPYLALFGAVLATGWFGGIGPALLAAALGAVVGALYLYPASGGTDPYSALVWFVTFSLALAAALDSWRRALERASDALERVRAHERELEAARDAAEIANRAKSRFFATVSHEIRTPLNAVIGLASVLLETRLTPPQRDLAQTIRSSSEGLLELLNDVLDFSKIESGRLELDEQPLVLRECLTSVSDLLGPNAASKGLALRHAIAPGVPEVVIGDATRLRQILVNLVANAIKFTERGEVELTVAARALDETTASGVAASARIELRFAVRDTGVGVPLERRGELFQSFMQLDTSGARRATGTGLGLAISRALAEAMGGTIWVESEGVPGRGSTFYVTMRTRPALTDAGC